MVKPEMSPLQAAAVLESRWGPGIERVIPVDHGEISRAFLFSRHGRDYVARFNASPSNFELDRYAGLAFAAHVPAPPIREIGQADGLYYAISERVPGTALQTMAWPWAESVRASLLTTLDALARIDLSARPGCGPVGPDGAGHHESWEEYLLSLFSDRERGFWEGWQRLFATSFLERDLFHRVHYRMRSLIPYCRGERAVVHGDFHVGNILSDGRAVTGLIDWANLKYGDPLYDVAVFHFWTPAVELPDAHAARRAEAEPHRRERLLCYTLCLGLDALRFFARTERRDAYTSIRERLLGMVEEAGA